MRITTPSRKKPGNKHKSKDEISLLELPKSLLAVCQTCKNSRPNPYPAVLSLALSAMWISPTSFEAVDNSKRIEMWELQSNVFKTCLAGKSVGVTEKNGIVTLTGVVTDDAGLTTSGQTTGGDKQIYVI